MRHIPSGKGMFIWLLDRLEGGDMVALANRLAAEGYKWVCVKAQDGILHFEGYKPYRQQALLAELVPALKAVGIELHVWVFIYGQSPYTGKSLVQQEIQITLEVIARWDPVSLHVNAEDAYKHSGAYSHAITYMAAIKSGYPDLPIGLSSYKFPEYHRELPFAAFGIYSEFWAPQVYWQKASNPAAQLIKSIEQYQAIKDLPFVPAGTLYPEGIWWPTPGQLDEFNAEIAGLPSVKAVYYWEYYYLYLREENREALTAFDYNPDPGGGTDPDPGACDDCLSKFRSDLNYISRQLDQAQQLLSAASEDLNAIITELAEG